MSQNDLSIFYEKNIYPRIKNKSNYETIKANLTTIAKDPSIVKSRCYQQAWEECCRLFEIGMEIAFTEKLYSKRSLPHFCRTDNKCQRCQDKEMYKNKSGKIETIEEEILKRYNNMRKKSYEYTSSSEDDRQFNNYDLFMTRVEKQCKVPTNDVVFPIEGNENEDIMIMEISSEESKGEIDNKVDDEKYEHSNSDNFEFLSHSPTFDTVDTNKNVKLSLNNTSSRQSQSIKKTKLKEFQFKFTKRENIDKKILRKFRKFLKEKYKKNQANVVSIISNNKFWQDFITLNLLPPFSYNAEEKDFKSCNTGYMCWVFEHPSSVDLYNIFIKSNYQNLISHFEMKYHLNSSDEEYIQLKTYLNTLALVFSCSQNSESTVSDTTDFIFEVNPTNKMEEDFEVEHELYNKNDIGNNSASINRFNSNFVSLHPQMPDIFNELINCNRNTLYSKSFGYKNEVNDTISDESNEYGGNKEEFDSDSD